jgi:hypothetical protein
VVAGGICCELGVGGVFWNGIVGCCEGEEGGRVTEEDRGFS